MEFAFHSPILVCYVIVLLCCCYLNARSAYRTRWRYNINPQRNTIILIEEIAGYLRHLREEAFSALQE